MTPDEIKQALGLEIYQALHARPDKDPRRDLQAGEKLWIAAASPMVDYLWESGSYSSLTLQQVTDNGATTDQSLTIAGLDMSTHKIINVVDPTANQDAATKKYVDDNTGGDGSASGSVGNFHINMDGPDGDSFLYFYESSSPTGAYLMWDEADTGFKFSHDLSMNVNQIHNVASPSGSWDAANKAYVDTVSGSIGTDLNHQVLTLYDYVDDNTGANTLATLDDVCDNGATTDQSLTIAGLDMSTHKIINVVDPTANQDAATKKYVDDNTGGDGSASGSVGNFHINMDGPDADSYLYFYNVSATGASLKWDDSDNKFIFSHNLEAANFHSRGNVYINEDGGDADSYLYFYEGGSAVGRYLRWSNTYNRFEFSDNLKVVGVLTATSIFASGHLYSDGDVYVNYDGEEGDSFLYFYEDGSSTGAYLKFDDSSNVFAFNHSLIVDGYVQVNYNVYCKGNHYVNYGGPDGDSYLYFYENSSNTGAYLKWDDNPGNFAINKALKVGDGGATNYTEIKDDGEINLHGTARVNNHIRVTAPSWKPGVVAPVAGYIGIIPTFKFDNVSDDSVHYSLICPHRMAAGTTIQVVIDWCYSGAQDNGTVCWALQYINVAPGENLAGSTTTESKVSTANNTPNVMVRTTFTTGITGAVAHDVMGLRLYRDISADTLDTDAHLVQVHFCFITDKLGEAT